MNNRRGFTLIELIIVIAVFAIVTAVAGVSMSSFLTKNQLDINTQQIVQLIRKAQSNSMQSFKDSQWGVLFENNTYTFFKGNTYGIYPNFEDSYPLPSSLSFTNININGGDGDEIVFQKITGETVNTGSIEITERNTNSSYSININTLGQIETN